MKCRVCGRTWCWGPGRRKYPPPAPSGRAGLRWEGTTPTRCAAPRERLVLWAPCSPCSGGVCGGVLPGGPVGSPWPWPVCRSPAGGCRSTLSPGLGTCPPKLDGGLCLARVRVPRSWSYAGYSRAPHCQMEQRARTAQQRGRWGAWGAGEGASRCVP